MQVISSLFLSVVLWACTTRQNAESITTRTDSATVKIENDTVPVVSADTALLENLLDLDSDADILNRFGNRISHHEQFSSEVEGSWQVTKLFPRSRNEVTFEWRDSENFLGLNSITIAGTDSNWKTKSGIKLGMKRADLEQLNGKPFLFYYLGWNFEGEVFWNGGALEKDSIHVVIGPRENSRVDPTLYHQEPEQVPSNSVAAKNSDLIVVTISFRKDARTAQ